jgi:D-amino-acid dehydrogenase
MINAVHYEPNAPAANAQLARDMFDVVVLGAGVVGATTAYACAARGLSVALVDQRDGPALGASFANGAQLSYAYTDAMGSPALAKKLPAFLLGADPLFKIKIAFDPDMALWGLKFLASCTDAQNRAGTLETLALALESRRALHTLLERHPFDFGHRVAGKMHLYADPKALKAASKMVDLKRRHGAVQHVLSAAEAVAIEPALRQSKDLAGVVYSPEDEVGDPHLFAIGLIEVLKRQFDVSPFFSMEISGTELGADEVRLVGAGGQTIRGRTLIVALGADAGAFLARLGVRAAILPMKGYSFTAPLGPDAPAVSLTDTVRKLVFCQLSGRMRVAGVAQLGSRDTEVEQPLLAKLIEAARSSLQGAADYSHVDGGWAGLRPMTPSSTPHIARLRQRLIVNIGHGMLGWTLAMGSAERAAQLVMSNEWGEP